MHALLVIALTLLTADGSDLQGNWQGTGRDARYSAAFCFDVLAMRVGTDPILELRESRFRVDQEQGTLDIERSDGLQLGRYAIEGDTLTIMLADVNLPRPESIDFPIVKPTGRTIVIDRKNWTPRTQQRYIFERIK